MKTLQLTLLFASMLWATAVSTFAAPPPQSPIDFVNVPNANLRRPAFDYPNLNLTLTTINKSAQMGPAGHPAETDIKGTVPDNTAKLRYYGEEYRLKQFHFHHRSEHLLGGNDFAMELHLVHELYVGGQPQGQFLAIGHWIEPTFSPGQENAALAAISMNLPAQPALDGADNVNTIFGLALNALLPADPLAFIHYHGSLTTFKTNAELAAQVSQQAVEWIMYQEPLLLTQAKINIFAAHPAMGTVRPANPLGLQDPHRHEALPEPSTLLLLAIGGLFATNRRKLAQR